MYYKARQEDSKQEGGGGLSAEQIRRAERAFTAILWRRRCYPDFIAAQREEIFALALTEYTRALAKGAAMPEPVGWVVNCAWRRTQNLLTVANRTPPPVSEDALLDRVDQAAPSAEQLALDEDRARKVRAAVGELSEDQRRLLALTYFSDNSVRAAARLLGWDPGKAKRAHKTALRKIHELLGVEHSDELQFDVALIALLSLGGGSSALQLPAGIEAALERAGHVAGGAFSRVQELARRVQLGGGDGAAQVLSGAGAGRGLGACATIVAAACIAGAGVVVGPGAGLFDHHAGADSRPPARPPARSTGSEASVQPPPPSDPVSEVAGPTGGEAGGQEAAAESPAPPPADEAEQVKRQTDAFARAGSEAAPAQTSSNPSPPPQAPATAAGPSPQSQAQAKQQFGAFP